MLMRSEGNDAVVDCDDPVIALACNLDSEDCPAACKSDSKNEEKGSDEKVRSGDLAVTADAAANRKILKKGTSDLDTITFKTSEEVEISKITLERYGYSESDQITEVRLEDQDGNVIADGKGLTKDKVTLNLKKDYRKVDGEFEATVVVTTSGAAGTIGFKVTDVESTAKNLNLDDYNPYTYEVVDYKGSTVTVELKGSNKSYNYEEGESYEIGRIKVSAGDNAVLVKGMTLTNSGKVDLKESLDNLTVKVDSKEVKAKASINKDDELVVTFNEDVEIGINKKATFVLEASFKDFDDYGESVALYVAENADFNAVEKKNGTRVDLDLSQANKSAKLTVYTFNGGKIKITNKKLGSVDAAQASEGIVIAEWDITITEPISKIAFDITVNSPYVEKLSMFVNGDEFEGKKTYTDVDMWVATCTKWSALDINTYNTEAKCVGTGGTWKCTAGKYNSKDKCTAAYTSNTKSKFSFTNVNIDESGKVQFKVDIADDENAEGSFTIGALLDGAKIDGAKYDNVSKQYVKAADVAGSISASKVTIQPAKAALENKLSKDVDFIFGETSRKVVFDGTYTARKADINLNKFTVSGSTGNVEDNKVTFYLFVDWEEVADTNTLGQEESFSDVLVKAGDSVKVKVEAEVEAYSTPYGSSADVFTLELRGTDTNGNEDTGRGSDNLKWIKIKGKGTVTVEKSAAKNTINLRKANSVIAEFTVAPSKDDDDVLIEDLVIKVTKAWAAKPLTGWQIRVKLDGVEQYDSSFDATSGTITYDVNETINGKAIISIALKAEDDGEYTVEVSKINENKTVRTYKKYFAPAVVVMTKQEDLDGTTKFTYDVTDKSDSDYTVSDFCIYSESINSGEVLSGDAAKNITASPKALGCKAGDIEWDNLYFEVSWSTGGVTFVKAASYIVDVDGTATPVFVNYQDYADYFSINGADARVYKVKN